MSKSWDSGILKKLKSLVGKGLSTAEIGKKLGISKNAVVGKLHRMGWNSGAVEAPAAKKKTTKDAAKTTSAKTGSKVTSKTGAKKTATKVATTKTVRKTSGATKAKASASNVKVAQKTKATKTETVKSSSFKSGGSKKNLTVHQRIIQHSLEMMDLKPGQCRWPIGDPDSENFHFCGRQVFVGKPYCYEHCKQAYQFSVPKKK